jgi:hypothetical protein
MPIEVKLKSRKSTRRLQWIQLFISGCLTSILGIFTIIYTIQQNVIADGYVKHNLIAAQILHEQSIYDGYINDVSKGLLGLDQMIRSKNKNWEQLKQQIRVKTLNALPQVNLNQRKKILFFLYDNELIRSYPFSDLISLSGADFSNLLFADALCYLVNLSLKNVFADHIQFHGCNLEYADFSGSRMVGAKFINTRMGSAKFIEANLTDAVFHQSNRVGLWLHNAVLVRSQFNEPPENMKFINTDLY